MTKVKCRNINGVFFFFLFCIIATFATDDLMSEEGSCLLRNWMDISL